MFWIVQCLGQSSEQNRPGFDLKEYSLLGESSLIKFANRDKLKALITFKGKMYDYIEA
jgi:hypothetical protein